MAARATTQPCLVSSSWKACRHNRFPRAGINFEPFRFGEAIHCIVWFDSGGGYG